LPLTSLQEELLTILLARSMFICLQWKSAVEECVAAMEECNGSIATIMEMDVLHCVNRSLIRNLVLMHAHQR